MSAYICDKEVFTYLVHAATTNPLVGSGGNYLAWFHGGTWRDMKVGDSARCAEVANLLYWENILGVSGRYPDEKSSAGLPDSEKTGVISDTDFAFCPWSAIDPVQVLKTVGHLEYQCDTHSGWYESEAFAILEAIRSKAILALPGYNEAEWGAPVEDLTPSLRLQ